MKKRVRYRRISVRIWSDEKVRQLGRDAAITWFYLLTHPNLLALGCMRAHPDALAAEIGWLIEPEAFRVGFERLVEAGMVLVDEDPDTLFLALPNFLRYNPPFSPNVVRGWKQLVQLVPECATRDRYFARVTELVSDLGVKYEAAVCETLPEPAPSAGGAHVAA